MALDDRQREAVMEAVRHGILIVTGGPGTGKTTTINAMIHFFEEEGADILLAAPTGRAAKRMTEATGCEAQDHSSPVGSQLAIRKMMIREINVRIWKWIWKKCRESAGVRCDYH